MAKKPKKSNRKGLELPQVELFSDKKKSRVSICAMVDRGLSRKMPVDDNGLSSRVRS